MKKCLVASLFCIALCGFISAPFQPPMGMISQVKAPLSTDGSVHKARIVETEAYCGKTERNAPMYEPGGIAYATKRDQNRKWRFVVYYD